MLSLSQTRLNFFPLFKIMRDTGMEMEVVYEGKVYHLSVTTTDKEPKLSRRKNITRVQAEAQQIDTENCPDCLGVMFNGICMSRSCRRARGSSESVQTAPLLPQ